MCAGMLGGCTSEKSVSSDNGSLSATTMASATPGPATAPTTQPAGTDKQVSTAEAEDPYKGHRLLEKPKVVAALMLQINDQFITVNEVLYPVRGKLLAVPPGVTEATFREKAVSEITEELRRQIGEALVLAEANRRLEDEDRKRIDQEYNDFMRDAIADAGGSRTKLDVELRKQNTTLDEAIAVKRREMTSRYYLRKKFFPQLGSTRAQLWQYYQGHRDEFATASKVQMQILSLPYKSFLPAGVQRPSQAELAAARRVARAKAERALARIQGGEEFAAVVREVSVGYHADQGGLWDYMEAGSFREKQVEAAAFAGEAGKVSEIIDGETGAFIVKTLGVQQGKVVSFEEAQDRIDRKLRDSQYETLAKQYFNELYAKARIVSADEFEKVVLDRAIELYYKRP